MATYDPENHRVFFDGEEISGMVYEFTHDPLSEYLALSDQDRWLIHLMSIMMESISTSYDFIRACATGREVRGIE